MKTKIILSLLMAAALLLSPIQVPLTAAAQSTKNEIFTSGDTTDTDDIPDVTPYISQDTAYSHNDDASAEIETGKCGESASYTLYASGRLYVYGSGATSDYSIDDEEYSPFYALRGMVREIIVEKGITSLGNCLFAFLSMADEIHLPEGLEKIGLQAFMSCNSALSASIPESVTEIGDHAVGYKVDNGRYGIFQQTSLYIVGQKGTAAETYASENDLTFYERVQKGKCGENAYWVMDMTSMRFTVFGTGAMNDYTWEEPMYTISFRKNFSSIVIENGITHVGANLFKKNIYAQQGDTSIYLADSVESVGEYAFSDIDNITQVHLSDNLSEVGYQAIDMAYVKNIYIPKGIDDIYTLFTNRYGSTAENLEWADVSPENEHYTSEDGIIYSKDKTKLELFPQKYVKSIINFPKEIETFSYYSFNPEHSLIFNIPADHEIPDMYFDILGQFSSGGSTGILVVEGEKRGNNYSWDNIPYGSVIFCDLDDSDWKELAENTSPERNITFLNINDIDKTIVVSAEKQELAVGETTILTALDLQSGAVPCEYTTSTPDVAEVENGRVKAKKAGRTEITASSAEGKTGRLNITVTGEAEAFTPYDIKSHEIRDLSDISDIRYMIPCEKLGGIYFEARDYNTSGYKMYFYSLNDSTVSAASGIPDIAANSYYKNEIRDIYSNGDSLCMWSNESCYIYDLVSRTLKLEIPAKKDYEIDTAAIDSHGRVYVSESSKVNGSDYRVLLYSADGDLLDEQSSLVNIYRFGGFNDENGIFAMETYYNYYSWGYNHPGHGLTLGRVADDKITFEDTTSGFLEQGLITRSFSCLLYLGQNYFRDHTRYIDMVGGKYLVATSMIFNSLNIYNTSESFEPMMSLSNNTFGDESDDDSAIDYIGVRTVFNESDNTISAYTTAEGLNDYNADTGMILGKRKTEYPVYDMVKYKDSLILLEKITDADGNSRFVLELFGRENDAYTLTAQPEKEKMYVGQSQTVSVKVNEDPDYELFGTWKSSDESVITVSDSGIACAWRSGKTTLTFTSANGKYTASCDVTVMETESSDDVKKKINDDKALISDNVHDQDQISYMANPMYSYLCENDDSTFTRVEFYNGKLHIENYSYRFSLNSTKTLEPELPIFGGFFAGKDNYYIVYGHDNMNEDDEQEVLRVIKYTKDWERIASASVKAANTYIPFDAGSLRMDESGGKLYIHTCHEMYAEEDEIHHQANMSFILDEAAMTFDDSYYRVYNFSEGYVSHSFNQFVKTDGSFVYRVDHGDSHPRGIGLSRMHVGSTLNNVQSGTIYSINGGWGMNATGVSVGGMELSSENVLVAFNSVDMSDEENYNTYGTRDIYLSVTNKDTFNTKTVKLTEHTEDQHGSTPQLVKIGEDQFLILWEERSEESDYVVGVTVDGNGRINARRIFRQMQLSDCQPVCASDGMVKWYVTNGKAIYFYSIDPFFDDGISSQWEYSIEYDLSGGTLERPNIIGYTEETETFTLNNPSKEGYNFLGWTGSCGSDPQTIVTIEQGTSGDLHYTANFEPIIYTLSYELDGGENDPDNPLNYTIETDTFTIKAPSKDNCEFLGWTTETSDQPQREINITTGSTGDMIFKALWKRIAYSITYDLAGGTAENNPDIYTENTDSFTLNEPVRPGCEFIGWTGSNGSKAQKIVTVEKGTTGDLEFTARWSQIDYTITYDLDGGTFTSPNKTSYNIETESFDLLNPVKDGFIFVGWSGSGIDGTKKDVTIIHGTTGDLSFRAVWEKDESQQPDIKDTLKGLLGDIDLDEEVNAADALAILRYSVGMAEFTPLQELLADVNSDTEITSHDALDVLRYSVGLSDNEEIGVREITIEL